LATFDSVSLGFGGFPTTLPLKELPLPPQHYMLSAKQRKVARECQEAQKAKSAPPT
jgi:hypothetical protein